MFVEVVLECFFVCLFVCLFVCFFWVSFFFSLLQVTLTGLKLELVSMNLAATYETPRILP